MIKKSLTLLLILVFITTIYAGDYAKRYPTDTALEVETPASVALKYLKLDCSNDPLTNDLIVTGSVITTVDGTITRDGDGYISEVALASGRTLTVSRSSGYISSIADGTYTWTFIRNGNNQITNWIVTGD